MRNAGCLYGFFGIFAVAGLICGIVGFAMMQSRNRMEKEGVKTTGRVIDLNYSKNSVAPVVSYSDARGSVFVHHSSTYTNIDPYQIGDTLTLWYLPSAPSEVALDGEGWVSWLPFLFLFTHGGIGIGGLVWMERRRRRMKWLQENGTAVQARFKSVKISSGKNRNYYSILCEWEDPVTQEMVEFESEQMASNPENFMASQAPLRVLIDPADPRRYWVDTTFLSV